VRALSRLPPDERPRLTLFCRGSTSLFDEVCGLVDRVVVYESPLDRIARGTRFAVDAERVQAFVGSALLGEAAPDVAREARREGVEAIFPAMKASARRLPTPIAWIPDLQHRVLPELFSRWARAAADRDFQKMLRDPGRHVVFSSASAMADAMRAYGRPRAAAHVLQFTTVPLPHWSQDPAPFVSRYALPPRYYIVCNQFWVHKDHLTAFRAVAKLKRRGMRVDLVCTGPTHDSRHSDFFPWLEVQIKALAIEEQIHILGTIPRVDQVCLMRAARAVLQPSRFEGWSTVLEDARAVGKEVIASDFPVHLEQEVPGSSFFRMGDADDCARAIAAHLEHDREQDGSMPTASHDLTILRFARAFMAIVDAALGRRIPSAGSTH
jgi:glycosyltransferase involved in cell wall biosynthesis